MGQESDSRTHKLHNTENRLAGKQKRQFLFAAGQASQLNVQPHLGESKLAAITINADIIFSDTKTN